MEKRIPRPDYLSVAAAAADPFPGERKRLPVWREGTNMI
jgi:hypothetical protein